MFSLNRLFEQRHIATNHGAIVIKIKEIDSQAIDSRNLRPQKKENVQGQDGNKTTLVKINDLS